MKSAKPDQVKVTRDGLLTSRSLTKEIIAVVPSAQDLVRQYFGRRPLCPVEIVVTSDPRIPQLAATAQGTASALRPRDCEGERLTLTSRPRDLHCVTLIAPPCARRVLINAGRLRIGKVRNLPRQIMATLVWSFVEVDQLCRKGAWDHRVALTLHEFGIHSLPKHKARAMYRIEAAWEREAEQVTDQIVGRVIRQNRRTETAA